MGTALLQRSSKTRHYLFGTRIAKNVISHRAHFLRVAIGREQTFMLHWIRTTWCKSMHNQAMWPMHGKYICPQCLQEYPVAWEAPATTAAYVDPAVGQADPSVAYAVEQRLC